MVKLPPGQLCVSCPVETAPVAAAVALQRKIQYEHSRCGHVIGYTSFSLLSLLPQVSPVLVAGGLRWRELESTKTAV